MGDNGAEGYVRNVFRATLPIHKAFMETDIQITGCDELLNEPSNEPLKGVVLQVYQLIVARPGIKKVEIANNVKMRE